MCAVKNCHVADTPGMRMSIWDQGIGAVVATWQGCAERTDFFAFMEEKLGDLETKAATAAAWTGRAASAGAAASGMSRRPSVGGDHAPPSIAEAARRGPRRFSDRY